MPASILLNGHRHLSFQPKLSAAYQSNPCPPITPAIALATAIITFKITFQLFFFIFFTLLKMQLRSRIIYYVSITTSGAIIARSTDPTRLLKLNTLKQSPGSTDSRRTSILRSKMTKKSTPPDSDSPLPLCPLPFPVYALSS